MGMKIAMINGSPKGGQSNSGFLLERLRPLLPEDCLLSNYRTAPKPLKPEQYEELLDLDVWVLASPVYFDAIPSHLVRLMLELEHRLRAANADGRPRPIRVYALVNNGFYEGRQAALAVGIVRNWCVRCGLTFGGAIGHGAGEMFGSLRNVPLGHGPLKNLGRAMQTLAGAIAAGASIEPVFLEPNFPRPVWKLSATHGFWNAQAKKNGVSVREIRRRPNHLQPRPESNA